MATPQGLPVQVEVAGTAQDRLSTPDCGLTIGEMRLMAVSLVGISIMIVFLLANVLQVLAWEMRSIYAASGLPPVRQAKYLIELFGYRPHTRLIQVLCWFWWPFVFMFGLCLIRERQPVKFAVMFLFSFTACWLAFIAAIAFILTIWSSTFIILLTELGDDPPAIVALIDPLTWAIPILSVLLLVREWRRARNRTRA